MIFRLARKDMGRVARNPLIYIGMVLIFLLVLYYVSPYWDLYQGVREAGAPVEYGGGDITDGYIPCSKEETQQHVIEVLTETLISDCGLSETEAKTEAEKMVVNDWDIEQSATYYDEHYGLMGIRSLFETYDSKKVDQKEMQTYLSTYFSEHRYTNNIAFKYSDYLGIGSTLYTVLIFFLILAKDLKKDMYAILHTKTISAVEYISSKMLAGIGTVCAAILPITLAVEFITMKVGQDSGFQISIWDIPINVIRFNLPAILLTGSLMVFIALLFRNIVPTIPAMLIYYMYSNMGRVDPFRGYAYQVKPFTLFIRFPVGFSKLTAPSGANVYIISAILASLFLVAGSILLWDRRRGI